MEVSPRHAVLLRLRFLQEEILEATGLMRYYEWLKSSYSKYKREYGEIMSIFTGRDLAEWKKEVQALTDYLNGKFAKSEKNTITPQMIDRARHHSIADLLEEKPKGSSKVVCCPFHTDKAPSASIKNNVLVCFAGCKPKDTKHQGWNPILLLMERDGMSFPAAVRALQ